MEKVVLAEKFGMITDYWNPRIVGELNNQHVKVVRVKGEFDWHHHENEDELFFVVKGELTIRLREKDILLREGEFFIIPRGVEHQPFASEEVHLLLFEPATTVNTGNFQSERTRINLERI